MSDYQRVYLPGGLYFFTVVTSHRQCFLTDDDVRAALREGIQFTRQTKPFEIVAWVLLPDHLYCQRLKFTAPRYIIADMIQTFRCKHTAALFAGKESRKWPVAFQLLALRKLAMLDAAFNINNLRIPPGNRLEKLSGNRAELWSVRINNQWRLCFRFENGCAYDVEIVDYH